jgi:hypothetical protein
VTSSLSGKQRASLTIGDIARELALSSARVRQSPDKRMAIVTQLVT